ncbi:PH domain-containing protein [Candidatus Halobonum tyrrellensis]|uniref:Membrane-flanked domain-containing protein n=1 Tax=Candidatus Halobonum tyrrellensis G22 TaxID=1324957 RepID=V4J083_9EURY|nr:PH domain-containing protein [Candidatus Halobonum tyrrellensis]ESP88832.1 membrane-flanked domain-containing protein [Candidatus Halobonum tyrrellensis G22]
MTRLHPLSAVVGGLQSAVQVGSFGFFAGAMLSGTGLVDGVDTVFVLAPLGALVGVAYAVARYLRFDYELEGNRLVVTSGVFSRQEREIPLRRVQNVDVSRDLLHRLLGLAVVRFETAGGSSTEAELDAVGSAEADRLREEVGSRARRARERSREDAGAEAVDPDGREESGPGGSAERTERETLYEISTQDLVTLSAVSFRPGAILAPFFGAGLFDDLLGGVFGRFLRAAGVGVDLGSGGPSVELFSVVVSGVVAVVAGLLTAWVASALITFVRYYDFRLERVADELRYERGLLGRYSGTIPLGKVQTLTVGENPLMRRLGYASLAVETAGYAPGSESGGGGAETTVPLASRERVLELARDVYGFGEPSFDRPPERARRRYTRRYALAAVGVTAVSVAVDRFLFPLGLLAYVPLVGLLLAPVAARAKWRHLGYDDLSEAFVARAGFWRRHTRVVPYYRLQTVFVSRTVFQRRFDLASVVADTASTTSLVGGDATAHDVDGEVATALREHLLDRLRADLAERRAADGADERPSGGTADTLGDRTSGPPVGPDGSASAPPDGSDGPDGSDDARRDG